MSQHRPSVRWNLVANFGGQFWRALMSLAFVPFYLRILGVEAYGLIGLYTGLQLALALLDAGLRPALAREMARFTGGAMDATEIRILLRSVELPLAGLSLAIGLIAVAAAPLLAHHWVHPQEIPPDVVTHAFMIMGLVAAAQFIESAYDSCLAGLQRQVVQNIIASVIATLRGFGALVVLWANPQITAFFAWQGVVAVVSLAALGAAVYRSLPAADGPVRFSSRALAGVRGYALGMLGISVLALLLTQSDRFLLARFMPLADVGHYALAASLVGAISMFSAPIGSTFYPRITALLHAGDEPAMICAFHHVSKLMVLVVGTASAMFCAFGGRLMGVWIHNPEISARAAPIMALLALGALFNSLTFLPYMLQLAHGVTAISLRINAALLVVFAPSLYLMVSHFGGVGAGACAAGLNLLGMVLAARITFRRYLPGEARRWWVMDIGRPAAAIFGTALLLRMAAPAPLPFIGELLLLGACGIAIFGAALLADRELRDMSRAFLQRHVLSRLPGTRYSYK